MTTRYRMLAAASLVATFALVTIGGLVRATKSGLGCGDNWPHCPGEVDRALLIEASHRFAAGLVMILLGLVALTAYRSRRSAPHLLWPSLGAFALVLVQALLGAVVVWLELEALSVVLHLGTALALIAVLVYLVTASGLETRPAGQMDPLTARRASGAALGVFVLLLVGSYVTGRGAGNPFPDWPLMGGKLVPDLSVEVFAVHFLHRALAAIVGVIVVATALTIIRRKQEVPGQARLAHAAAGLFALEVLLGAANVWTDLNPAFVTLHLLLGALVWASLVGIALMSLPLPQGAGERLVRSPTLEVQG